MILKFEMLSEIYSFLSPYLKTAFGIWFTAWIGHRFFLKKYVKEKKADRNHQIYQQKDSLNKEIFDQIQLKVCEIYESLGWIRAYHKLLPNSYSKSEFFKKYIERFNDRCSLLVDQLFLLALLLEKYDFIIDPRNVLSSESMKLHKDLGDTQFSIISDIKDEKHLNELCKDLFDISKKINRHIKKVSDESKKILKGIFDSLDKRIKRNKI